MWCLYIFKFIVSRRRNEEIQGLIMLEKKSVFWIRLVTFQCIRMYLNHIHQLECHHVKWLIVYCSMCLCVWKIAGGSKASVASYREIFHVRFSPERTLQKTGFFTSGSSSPAPPPDRKSNRNGRMATVKLFNIIYGSNKNGVLAFRREEIKRRERPHFWPVLYYYTYVF